MRPEEILVGHTYAGGAVIEGRRHMRYVWAKRPAPYAGHQDNVLVILGRGQETTLEEMALWAVEDVTEVSA